MKRFRAAPNEVIINPRGPPSSCRKMLRGTFTQFNTLPSDGDGNSTAAHIQKMNWATMETALREVPHSLPTMYNHDGEPTTSQVGRVPDGSLCKVRGVHTRTPSSNMEFIQDLWTTRAARMVESEIISQASEEAVPHSKATSPTLGSGSDRTSVVDSVTELELLDLRRASPCCPSGDRRASGRPSNSNTLLEVQHPLGGSVSAQNNGPSEGLSHEYGHGGGRVGSVGTGNHAVLSSTSNGDSLPDRCRRPTFCQRTAGVDCGSPSAEVKVVVKVPRSTDAFELDGSVSTRAHATVGGTSDGSLSTANSRAPVSFLQSNAQHQRAAGTRGAYQHGGLPGKTDGVEPDDSGGTQARATVGGTYDGAPPSDNSRAPATLPQIKPTGTRGVHQHGELPGTSDGGESDDGVGTTAVGGTLDGTSPSDGRLAPVSFPQANKQFQRADVDSRGIDQRDGVRDNPAGGEEEVDGVDAEEITTSTPTRISTASERQQIRRDTATENNRIAMLRADVQADEIRSDGAASRRSSSGAHPTRTATNDRHARQLRQLQQVEMKTALLDDAAKDSNENARGEGDFDDGVEEAERVFTTPDASWDQDNEAAKGHNEHITVFDARSSDQDNDAGKDHSGHMGVGGLTYSTGQTRYANGRRHIGKQSATVQIARGSTVDRPRQMMQESAHKLKPLPKRSSLPTFKTPKRRLIRALQQQQPNLSDILSEAHPDDTEIASLLLRMCALTETTIAGYETVYDTLVKSDGDTIDAKQLFFGLQSVCKYALKNSERDFVVEVLDLLQSNGPFQSQTVTFEEFAMAAALSRCVVNLSAKDRNLIKCLNLDDQKRKAILMFFIDANEDCTLSLEDLGVLMDAGRVDERQIKVVLDHLAPYGDSITLLQYLAHLPLFLDVHHEIVENTLDSTRRLV